MDFFSKAKNTLLQLSEAEVAVRDATTDDGSIQTNPQLQKVAQFTYSHNDYSKVQRQLFERLSDTSSYPHVYKSLLVCDYLLKAGSERFLLDLREYEYSLRSLLNISFYDEHAQMTRTKQVHKLVNKIIHLLKSPTLLATERKTFEKKRNIYTGISSNTRRSTIGSNGIGNDSYRYPSYRDSPVQKSFASPKTPDEEKSEYTYTPASERRASQPHQYSAAVETNSTSGSFGSNNSGFVNQQNSDPFSAIASNEQQPQVSNASQVQYQQFSSSNSQPQNQPSSFGNHQPSNFTPVSSQPNFNSQPQQFSQTSALQSDAFGQFGHQPMHSQNSFGAQTHNVQTNDPFGGQFLPKSLPPQQNVSDPFSNQIGQSQPQFQAQPSFKGQFVQTNPQNVHSFGGSFSQPPQHSVTKPADPFGGQFVQTQQQPSSQPPDPFGGQFVQAQRQPSSQPPDPFGGQFVQTQQQPSSQPPDPFGGQFVQTQQQPSTQPPDPFGGQFVQTQQNPVSNPADPFGGHVSQPQNQNQFPISSQSQAQPADPFGSQFVPNQTNDPFGQQNSFQQPKSDDPFSDQFPSTQKSSSVQKHPVSTDPFGNQFSQSQPQQLPPGVEKPLMLSVQNLQKNNDPFASSENESLGSSPQSQSQARYAALEAAMSSSEDDDDDLLESEPTQQQPLKTPQTQSKQQPISVPSSKPEPKNDLDDEFDLLGGLKSKSQRADEQTQKMLSDKTPVTNPFFVPTSANPYPNNQANNSNSLDPLLASIVAERNAAQRGMINPMIPYGGAYPINGMNSMMPPSHHQPMMPVNPMMNLNTMPQHPNQPNPMFFNAPPPHQPVPMNFGQSQPPSQNQSAFPF